MTLASFNSMLGTEWGLDKYLLDWITWNWGGPKDQVQLRGLVGEDHKEDWTWATANSLSDYRILHIVGGGAPKRNLLFQRIALLCLWHRWLFASVIANSVTSDTLGKRPGPWDTVMSKHSD